MGEFRHGGKVETTRFSPDGKLLATVGEKGTALLWDISSKQSKKLIGHKGYVTTVGFSPKENKGLPRNKYIQINEPQRHREHRERRNGEGFCISFGTFFYLEVPKLATSGDDGTVRLWDYSGKQLKEFETSEGRVTQITFSRDGKLLTTSSATTQINCVIYQDKK